jgi:hypothetical protein
VHHGINFMFGENIFNLRADGKIGMAKDGTGGDGFAMTLQQIVQSNYAYPPRQQGLTANTADITRSAGDQNVQSIFSLAAQGNSKSGSYVVAMTAEECRRKTLTEWMRVVSMGMEGQER